MSDIVPPEEVRAFTLHVVDAGYGCIRMWPQIGAYTGIRPSNGERELFWGIIGDGKPGGFWVYPDRPRARAALRAWNNRRAGARRLDPAEAWKIALVPAAAGRPV